MSNQLRIRYSQPINLQLPSPLDVPKSRFVNPKIVEPVQATVVGLVTGLRHLAFKDGGTLVVFRPIFSDLVILRGQLEHHYANQSY
jgi:hypothetical protein